MLRRGELLNPRTVEDEDVVTPQKRKIVSFEGDGVILQNNSVQQTDDECLYIPLPEKHCHNDFINVFAKGGDPHHTFTWNNSTQPLRHKAP